jgi:hypothetical protein
MSKSIRDFFRLKSNPNSPKPSTDEIIMERKQVEEVQATPSVNNPPSFEELSLLHKKQIDELLKNLPSLQELYAYILTSMNKAIIGAKYMEIITGYSPNITATISDSYEDVIKAILSEPHKQLEMDRMAMRLKELDDTIKAILSEPHKQLEMDRMAMRLRPDPARTEGLITKQEHELKCDKIIARTWMGIDGDVVMLLDEKNRIDPELLALHRANVDISVQNWRYMLNTIVSVTKVLSTFFSGSQQSSFPSPRP